MKPASMIQCPKCSADNPPESRFCNSCGNSISAPSQMPTAARTAAEPAKAPAETPHVARIISSDSIPAGGFTPGTILADRYRIIGLLGRGGMGEVYRADDLKLGQPVALKFLPPKLAQDPVRRERFFAEVRITRQLSHPNICRVYDIGEIDGRHFLSMEFIDGEDLASLLKRIGYLANEKALDIARQLAAGLAAAHERGVLHRDLKPANIMLDGHGRVRITDFGLAIAVEDESQATEIAGTPAYMAPEQLAGKGATVRSDMYSLGLVLYEIYTGKKAFTATTLAELREQKETHTPRAISELREGMDPVVERLIRRCMERDPNARPASVAQLAHALPGGDPLAAALAAGETPSPEMVAASGSKEGLSPAVAWMLLIFIAAGTLAIAAMQDRFGLHRLIPFKKQPAVLVERSQAIIKNAGYSDEFADSAYGFVANSKLLDYIEESNKTESRWRNLDAKAILFWYRQSPRPLEAAATSGSAFGGREFGSVTYDHPPMQFPGEILIMLDTEGRLVSLRVMPVQMKPSAASPQTPDWAFLFAESGLDPSKWTQTQPQGIPPSFADTRSAWRGSLPNRPNSSVLIEAAAMQGRPISFGIISPWTVSAQVEPFQLGIGQRVQSAAIVAFLAVTVIGGLFFALRNLRLGRGDRRSATRLALFIGVAAILEINLGAHHVSTGWEVNQLIFSSGLSLFTGCLIWILYMAIEPYVRRRWPQILVSSTRLLSGDWKDPLVARDVLVGCAVGILNICLIFISIVSGHALIERPITFRLQTVNGISLYASSLIDLLHSCVLYSLGLVAILFFLRILLRNQTAALAISAVFGSFLFGPTNLWSYAFWMAMISLTFYVIMSYGLLAQVLIATSVLWLNNLPVTLDTSAWYFPYGFATLAIFAVIVLYAFRYSLGGRPLISAPRLDD
jgi:hypothetical protein